MNHSGVFNWGVDGTPPTCLSLMYAMMIIFHSENMNELLKGPRKDLYLNWRITLKLIINNELQWVLLSENVVAYNKTTLIGTHKPFQLEHMIMNYLDSLTVKLLVLLIILNLENYLVVRKVYHLVYLSGMLKLSLMELCLVLLKSVLNESHS